MPTPDRTPSAATVWLVTANCGDYYCEGVHVVAVARSAEEAETLKAEAEEATWTNSAGSSGKRWSDVEIEEVQTSELREKARSFVYPA